MESSHIISIVKVQMKKENNNKILPRDKHNETRNIIHSIKVGVSLVLVSLMYLLNPLFHQVGENAMWAVMTVIVIFEFSAGATLGKGFNRGMGTIVGGGLGWLAAIFAQSIGGVGNSIIIGTVGTYIRLIPRVKERYEYGVVTLMLTFNLVVMYGLRANEKVWEITRQRLLSILMGFIVCICVSLFIFPLWASDELHHSTVSTFHDLANTIQGCLEENGTLVSENESQLIAGFNFCNSVLNSKSEDELLANSARWEPWHGKFGFCYPWENYLKIASVLRELATFILVVGHSLQSSKQDMACLRQSHSEQLETCEAIGSRVAWALRELGDSMKQMKKCEENNKGSSILAKLKACKAELSMVISTSKVAILENGQVLAISSLVFLLMKVVEKVEELVQEVEELGQNAAFRINITIPLSS
ncbi:hypothetical protein Lal_00033090 [Lupinus albus]|nr:hypothetical protein Lal_00033090 [Lupinus albus]